MQTTLTQILSACDAILNIPVKADWKLIMSIPNRTMLAKMQSKYLICTMGGDKVLVSTDPLDKYSTTWYMGQYEIET